MTRDNARVIEALVLLVITSCAKPAATTTIRTDAPTPLGVVVLDDYSTKDTCDGVAAHRIEIAIDGRPVGVIEVPCRTKVVIPPPQFTAPEIVLAPGVHRFAARDLDRGATIEKEIELPVIESSIEDGRDELGTRLPLWANDEELEFHGPKARITFER